MRISPILLLVGFQGTPRLTYQTKMRSESLVYLKKNKKIISGTRIILHSVDFLIREG